MLLSFSDDMLRESVDAPALPIFDERVCAFLSALSASILRNEREYSDVVTFGYWCRKSALASYSKAYASEALRMGRGLAFHVAPSNVPVNFAFSLAAGLLAGNKNVVKVPSKQFPQVDAIVRQISALLDGEFSDMNPYVRLVRYDRTGEETAAISAACDTRIIWGGDETIARIRENGLKPRANEITFADRNSISVIDGAAYLSSERFEEHARAFYNDTYFSDQNACTAPRLIVWLNDRDDSAKKRFWRELSKIVRERYEVAPVHAVGKLDALLMSAAHRPVHLESSLADIDMMRIRVDELEAGLLEDRYHSGFFFEYDADAIDEIRPLCDAKLQTVSYIGDGVPGMVSQFVRESGVQGVDRVVPIGSTMDFSLIWDGVDLISLMSRVVDVLKLGK